MAGKEKHQIDYNVCADTHVRSNKKSMYDMAKQMGCMEQSTTTTKVPAENVEN